MFVSGMTSVTFRNKSVKEVVQICKKACLEGLEWGGDVHIPPCSSAAAEARKICLDEGLRIYSYGSYFSVTNTQDYLGDFEKIAETCVNLGSKVVRIWATRSWRIDASPSEYDAFIKKMKEISDLARNYGITVCFEHHSKTFCDCFLHAKEVLSDIGRENVKTYWQPICDSFEENMNSAKQLKDQTVCLHVYHWKGNERYLLSEGMKDWQNYLSVFSTQSREIPCLLEFVKNDCDECFFSDADSLCSLLRAYGSK